MRRQAWSAAVVATLLVVAACTSTEPEPGAGTSEVGTSADPGTGTASEPSPGAGATATDPEVGTGPTTAAEPVTGPSPRSTTPQELAVLEAGGLTLLLATPGGDGGDDAQVSGELTTGPGGCLALSVGDAEPVLVVWPGGTEVEPGARPQVDAPGVGVVSVGERLEHAGGFLPRDTFDIPRRCLTGSGGEVAVLSAG